MIKPLTHQEMSSRGGNATKEKHPDQFKEMAKKSIESNTKKYGTNYMYPRLEKALMARYKAGKVSEKGYLEGLAKLKAKFNNVPQENE